MSDPTAPHRVARTERLLDVLIAILFVAVLATWANHALRVATFPYDWDNGEGFVLDQAVHWANGESPYSPIDEEPFLVSNFAPLYQWVVAIPIRIGGVSLVWGRWLSLLATIGTAFLVFFIARRLGCARRPALIGGLLFLSSSFVYDWTSLHRVDCLALFLTVLGLYVAVRSRRVEWAAIPFALAILTRQTMVFAPAAVLLTLLASRRFWPMVRLGALSFGAPAVIYLTLDFATNGEFLRHTVWYNLQEYQWPLVGLFATNLLRYHPVLLAAGLFLLATRLVERRLDLPAAYLLFGIASFFLCGKVGAASNYMFELVTGTCLAFALVAERFTNPPEDAPGDRLGERLGSPSEGFGASALFLRSALAVQLMLSLAAFGSGELAPTPDGDYRERADELNRLIASVDGDVLCEDNGYLLLNGKRITFEPFIMARLAEAGLWSPEPVLRWIAERRYSLVVLTFDVRRERSRRFDDRIRDAIAANYDVLRPIAGPGGSERGPSAWWNYWVYVPRPMKPPSGG